MKTRKILKIIDSITQFIVITMIISCFLFIVGAFIKTVIEDFYPGAFKDKNEFYYAYENRPDIFRNNFGDYCRESGVSPEWVVPNTYKNFDGETYVMYNLPESYIRQNYEYNEHGFLGLGKKTRDLDDQVRYYETGWVHYEDVQGLSCGVSRVKEVKTYKRFL